MINGSGSAVQEASPGSMPCSLKGKLRRCVGLPFSREKMNNPGMKFHRSRRGGVLSWVVLLCAATLLPSVVLAQPQHRLEDITVTARKQEQRAFDVPLSLSVLQGEGLDRIRSSGMDIRFLNNRVPSLQAEVVLWALLSPILHTRLGQYRL